MKLKFSIDYHTSWGQSLHVLLHYLDAKGDYKVKNFLMQTNDGKKWSVETVIRERLYAPINLTYHYQVEDEEGYIVRKEWNHIHRSYLLDDSKDYIFSDQWRDVPMACHLYSEAYSVTKGGFIGPLTPPQLSLFRKTLLLRVSAPQLTEHESLGVCGSHPTLGNWNPTLFLPMISMGASEWIIAINLDGIFQSFEYKFVVIDNHTHQIKKWEEGENRFLSLIKVQDGEVLTIYTDPLHLNDSTWYVAGITTTKVHKPLIDICAEKGFHIINWSPIHPIRISKRNVQQWEELAIYARKKRIGIIGNLKILLNESLQNPCRWRHRARFIAKYFSAVSIDFSIPHHDNRHDDYWAYLAAQIIRLFQEETNLLIYAGQESVSLDCLKPVFHQLRIPTLVLESMSQNPRCEFTDISQNPYHSIDSFKTSSMFMIEKWWTEDPKRTQRYYAAILQHNGKAPQKITSRIVEEIVARHFCCPSMICLIPEEYLQLISIEQLELMLKRSKR